MDNSDRPRASIIFPEQYPEAARALGRAFWDDAPLRVILPEVNEIGERARRMTRFFDAMLEIQRNNGQPVLGVVSEGTVIAAAIIEGAAGSSAPHTVLSGLSRVPAMLEALGPGGTMRAIEFLDELMRNHPPEPHIYLNFLGTDPDYQRRHCGIVLLEELRELAALRPSLCGVYLETASEHNVRYYQAHGYEVIGEIHPLGTRMWRMLQQRRN